MAKLFDPEDGGDMLLRNMGLSPNYMELQPGRLYSSMNRWIISYSLSLFLL
jgi:hypothetical protein